MAARRHSPSSSRVTLPPTARSRGLDHRHARPRPFTPSHKRALKHATMRDCGRRCVYCAEPLTWENATLDHVFPLSHGGAHAPGNIVSACALCNRLKGDLLPHEFFARFPLAGLNFMRYAVAVHRALKRSARKAVSLAYAA